MDKHFAVQASPTNQKNTQNEIQQVTSKKETKGVSEAQKQTEATPHRDDLCSRSPANASDLDELGRELCYRTILRMRA
jgi:hypothetical protein